MDQMILLDITIQLYSSNYGETFFNNSFCAFSSIIHKNDPKRGIYERFIRPTCYEMFCSDRSVTIRINKQNIVCPRNGGYINIGGNYTGYLLCPDYNLICTQTDQTAPCNNMFDCVDKHITMKEDYIYDYTPSNVTVQIIEINETGVLFDKGYEESENGRCPKN
jgi:hypothetical protein